MRCCPIVSLFVCAMTLLCPVLCLAEAAFHSALLSGDGEHRDSHGEHLGAAPGHEQPCGGAPHHHHTPDGEPVPASAHTCICTAGKPAGPPVQIPALDLHPVFGHELLAAMSAAALRCLPVDVGAPPDCPLHASLPLLI